MGAFLLGAALLLGIGPRDALAQEPVTRGEVLHQLIEAQNLPRWRGKTFSDVDPSSPYASALESALSMGILLPTDEFSPETPVANAEALMFALQTLGFHHEATVAQWALPPEDDRLPSYVSGFVALAKALEPRAPASLTDDPRGTTTRQELVELLRWVQLCRMSVVWDHKIETDQGILWIHREYAGGPARRWRLQLASFRDPTAAMAFIHNRRSPIPLEMISNGYDYSVVTPDLFSHAEAWAQRRFFGANSGAQVVPSDVDHQALFWAAFSPNNPTTARIAPGPQLHGSALPLSQIAVLTDAAAAINGGYITGALPIGTLIVDGIPVSATYRTRGMIGWNDQEVFFGNGAYEAFVQARGQEYAVAGINLRSQQGTGVYTPHFGAAIAKAGTGGRRYRVKDSQVIGGPQSFWSQRVIGDGEWMFLQRDDQAPELEPGDAVTIRLQWQDPVVAGREVLQAVQAGPLLYAPGRRYSLEDFGSAITRQRHPRTLAGWDGSRLWWMAVDGRSSWHSNGLTLEEAARLGRRLGFQALLNLDGGGSTELWWNGHIVNRVSDGQERPLPYGIVFPKG